MVDELLNREGAETPVKEETMEEIMQQYDVMGDFHRGKVVDGTIVDTREDGWLVDVGYKCEGLLARKEWTHRVLVEDIQEPQNGTKVRVQITNISQGEEAQLTLSRWRSEFDVRWDKLELEATQNDLLKVTGLRKVKGGLIVNSYGIEGFIPISHLAEEGRGVNPGKLIGQEFSAKLIEKHRRKRRLVFSRRTIVEEEMAEIRNSFYEQVAVGDVLEGDVSSITSFGVFVNLGAMEGLVHLSELSWQRNIKPKEIVSKGENVKVKVIGIDKEKNRISLSIKQTTTDPWSTVSERWTEGKTAKGTVTNLTDFGAFVEIEPGIEGLIHIGNLSWTRIKHPKEILKKGQEIEVCILETDTERNRISLGYKQLNDPWKNIETKYQKGKDVLVKVARLADFAAFVELEEGLEGLIHISQISQEKIKHPQDVLTEGQEISARIIDINPSERRIRLTLLPVSLNETKKSSQEVAAKKTQVNTTRGRRSVTNKNKLTNNNLPQEEVNVTIGELLKQPE